MNGGGKQRVESAAVGAQNLEAYAFEFDDFVACGNASEMIQDEPADGVTFPSAESGADRRVQVGDGGLRLDAISSGMIDPDVVVVFIEILFVFDVADDLFEDVFDGNQAAHARVFVDH